MIRIVLKEAVGIKNNPTQMTIQGLDKFSYEQAEYEGQLSPISVVHVLYKAGFTNRDILKEAVHIVLGESEGEVGLEHPNDDGTTDYGMWQINEKNLEDSSAWMEKQREIYDRYQGHYADLDNRLKRKYITQAVYNTKKAQFEKKEQEEKLFSKFQIPFITQDVALDYKAATQHAKKVYDSNVRNLGMAGRWDSWVPNASLLIKKYGIEKRKIAEQNVDLYFKMMGK